MRGAIDARAHALPSYRRTVLPSYRHTVLPPVVRSARED
jgi:hypothetical protein